MGLTTETVTMQMLPESVGRLVGEVTRDNGGEVPTAYRVTIYHDDDTPDAESAWALVARIAGRVGAQWGADMEWGDLMGRVDKSIAALLIAED